MESELDGERWVDGKKWREVDGKKWRGMDGWEEMGRNREGVRGNEGREGDAWMERDGEK